jgi:hypothetical protein
MTKSRVLCVIKLLFMSVNPFSASNLCLLLISAGLVVYLFYLWLRVKEKTSSADDRALRTPVTRFTFLYTLYFTGIAILAANQFFAVITMPPRFVLIFAPLLFIVVMLSRAKTTGSLRFLQLIPPVLLIAVHVYRLLIEIVFIQFAQEKIIPVELSVHGRNQDLWIGVLALPVAWLFWRKHHLARKAGITFNILGLLSLVNIFSIAVPSMPSTFRVYDTLYLPTYFPGILIVFLASAAIYLHILSLKQLLAMKATAPAKRKRITIVEKATLPL